METGYDILFFWVARMMMLGEWLTEREPFRTVYLHGLVRDPLGQKMSKSKGNVLDPLGVINELGADALRFALLHGPEPSQDQKMSRPRLQDARNFANKLWNAARFVLSSRPSVVDADASLGIADASSLGPAEHWILDRAAQTEETVETAYAEFEFGRAARILYAAIWNDYCDWYLELAKIGLADASADASRKRAIWSTLTWVLDRYLRLLHPMMPFLTEEIWGRTPHLADDPQLLIVAPWPRAGDAGVTTDRQQAQGVADLIEVISAIRAARAESGVGAADRLDALIWLPDGPAADVFPALEGAFGRLARIRPKVVGNRHDLDTEVRALSVITAVAEVRLQQSETDHAREQARLDRDLRAIETQLKAAETRLGDESFVTRAPVNVVEHARNRVTELRAQAEALRTRIRES
jgi:valyl-tRNA synthetase